MAKTPLSIYDLTLSEQAPVQEFKPQQSERVPSDTGGSVPANLAPVFNDASQKYQVPVNILMGLAEQESSFNPRALGSQTKWGRAKGLMQYLDSTAASMGINPYDPAQSIDAAAKQIRERLDKGYSMGEAVKAHFGGDNRKQWGAKTNQYEIDVMRRADKFLNGVMPGANVDADPSQQPEVADDTASTTGAPTPLTLEGQDSYRREKLQKMVEQLNTEEPDRYSVPTPEQIAAYQQQQGDQFKIELPIDVQQQMKDQEAQQTAQAQQQGNKDGNLLTDTGNLLWSGVNSAAENLTELVGRIPGVGPSIVKAVDRADRWLNDGKGTQEIFKEHEKAIEQRWTPEMLAARKKDFITEGKEGYSFGPAWSDPRSYYSGLVESLPETVLTMGVAGRLAKGAYAGMIAKGASRADAAKRAATVATVAGGIIEGGFGGAASSRQVRNEIMAMTPQQLQGSEVIKTMMADGMSFEDARKSLAEDSATKAFLIAGVGTGIFGGMGDRALAKIITTPAMGRLKSAAKGAVAEGLLEEMPQSAAQQMAENYSMQGADPTRPLTKGVANAMAQGMVIGGIMGAGMGAAAPHVQESGPLGKAINDASPDAVLQTAAPDIEQRVAEATEQEQAAAEKAAKAAPAEEAKAEQTVEQSAENWFGEPGAEQTVTAPGIEPFQATVEGYAPNGDVILRDETGQALQVGRNELTLPETAEAAPIQAETETKPTETAPEVAKSETEQPKSADLPPNVDPETGEIFEPEKAKTVEELDEPELRDRLKYVARQAKVSGWDSRLTNERKRIEKAIEVRKNEATNLRNEPAQDAEIPASAQPDIAAGVQPDESRVPVRDERAQAAADEPAASAGSNDVPVRAATDADPSLNKDGTQKWFGTERRANEYLAKKGIADTHEVQLVDRQFQIHLKAAPEATVQDGTLTDEGTTVATSEPKPARRKKEPTAEQAPASSPVAGQRVQGRIEGGPRRNRARKIIDAEIGTTVIPRGKVGMMSIGTPYRMTNIDKNGTAHFENLETGGSTSATMGELEAARSRSVRFDVAEDRNSAVDGVAETETQQSERQQNEPQNIPENIPDSASLRENANSSTETIRENTETSTGAPEYGADNKLVSKERHAELVKQMREKMRNLNSGIDPEVLSIGTQIAVYHIEAGVRKFAAVARAIAADLDVPVNRLRPYLRSIYNGARDMMEDSGVSIAGMDSAETVRAELAKLDQEPAAESEPQGTQQLAPEKQTQAPRTESRQTGALDDMVSQFDNEVSQNVPGTRSGVESDSQTAGNPVSSVQIPDVDGSGRNDPSTGRASERADTERGTGQRNQRVSDNGTAVSGERGDQRVYQQNGQFNLEGGSSRSAERTGGRSDSGAGSTVERGRAAAVAANADAPGASDLDKRLAAQKKASGASTTWGDRKSIDAALPLLLPEQRTDVENIEQRHQKASGILVTNGTGTGKTATGLGAAKRFYNAGKKNILITVPTDKIASDWVKFAGMMDMPLHQLTDTTDNGGKGPIVTTYANFAQNNALAQRDWDLVIPDESHYLSSNEAGDSTDALKKLRALTGHPDGFITYMQGRHADLYEKLTKAREELEKLPAESVKRPLLKSRLDTLSAKWAEIEQPARQEWQKRWSEQRDLPKVVFLSATPFAYVKSTDYAEGYLFHHVEPSDRYKDRSQGGYNSGSSRDSFYMTHFGYRMRYNKLTRPDAGVNSELMEQNFNQWLKDNGALIGRTLDVPHDYDRRFALVDDAAGKKLDDALRYLNEADNGAYRRVYDEVMKTFDYQSRMFLLESMKARAAVPIIKEHLAMGRKVVVFHDYNKGGGFSPFAAALNAIEDPEIKAQARQVFQRPEFQIDFSGLDSALATMSGAFPDALYFNGRVPKSQRKKNADTFNDDNSGSNLIVAQSDAAREGVSLHDTTGKHQRVEVNLGMPTRPVAATQIEGRIYRTGQASDAIFRYLTTGTGWEASAFASKIAERASTAENLALGTDARGLKQAFIDAYSNAEPMTASPEDGKGGKELDRAMSAGRSISPFDKAKTYYFAQQKNTKRRDQREGVDYFATPEPVGFKMVEWANIRDGDKALEPSAGHGAIARFFPAQTDVTMVEPSYDLSQRAALAQGSARIINGRFEDLSRTNKYDAIVMNPPYGSGGKTAIEHLEKAGKHLREGGRVVALIPRGGLTDPRLAAFMASDSAKGLHLVATIKMPWVTFERAGTKVATQVVIFEKHSKMADGESIQPQNIDLSTAEDVGELFDRIENVSVQPRRELTIDQVIANATDGNVYSVADVRSSITDGTLSKPFNALIDNGSVVIHATVPEGMPSNTQAWTAPDGTINLVADRLTPETAQGVLLHEAFHSGARALVGEARWKNLNDRFDGYLAAAERRAGSAPQTAWDKAYARVMHAENSGDTMDVARRREELAAYAIENFERMPSGIRKWAESIIGAVKEFIARRFGKQIGEVTPAQLRALAKEALRSGVTAPREQPAFSNGSVSTADLSNQLKADYDGLKLGLTGEGKVVTLSRIVLPASERNSGTGTEIMQRITDWADQNGKTVALTPSSDFGGTKSRLNDFYKRFGFIENKGSNRDFEISETMYREPKAADNRYSVGEDRPTAKETDSWISQKWDATKDLSDAALKTVMPSLLHWTPSRVILTKIGKDIPALGEYADTKLKMDTFRDEWHSITDTLAQRWTKYRKSNQQENSELMQVMHDSTLEQVDPTEKFASQLTPRDREALREGRTDTDAFKDAAAKAADDKRRMKAYGDIKARFDKLSPEAQAIYKDVRDTYKKLADTQEQIIADNLQKAMEYRVKEAERSFEDEMQRIRDDGLRGDEAKEAVDAAKKRLDNARKRDAWNKKARMTKLRQEFESNRLAGPYFPLSRFGDFFVTARDKATGEVVSFSRVETAREQARLKKQLARDGYDVEDGIVYKAQNLRKQVPADFVARIEDILKDIPAAQETQDQVWQLYLQNMPDYSLRKNRIHRKGRAGFEEDALRAFASHMFHGAHQTARLKYAMDLGDLIDVAKRQAKRTRSPVRSGMVVDQVEKNHAYVMNPTSNRLSQVATQSAFMYFLAQSPAAAMVNMSQTWILGVPKLASFYGGNTAKGMAVALAQTNKAMMDITRGGFFADKSKSVTADEKAAIEQAYRMGLITRTQSHDVAGIADSGIKYTATRAKLMASLSWMFHHTERVNREASFLAGYRMARRKGIDQQNAVRKAAELTWDTHFDYQNTSRPAVMHSNTGKALLVFRNYTLNMLADLAYNAYQVINPRNAAERKEARTQLLGVGTMLAFNAGIRGLPLYGLAMMIAGMFSDDGEDPETEMKKTLLTYLPPSLVGMMMDGVPGYAAGINLSARIGFGDLWFRSDDRDRDGEEAYNYWIQQVLGASVAIPQNWVRGVGQISDGYYWRGIENLLPKALKDPMKAARYYREGVTTKNGDPIVDDVNGWDIFKQAIGFSPAKVAEQYKNNSVNMNKQKAILAERSKLLGDYYKADQAGDEKRIEAIEKKMDEYSDKYPEMAIDGKTIKRSMKNREKYRDKSVGGMSYNNNLRDRLLEEQPPSVY